MGFFYVVFKYVEAFCGVQYLLYPSTIHRLCIFKRLKVNTDILPREQTASLCLFINLDYYHGSLISVARFSIPPSRTRIRRDPSFDVIIRKLNDTTYKWLLGGYVSVILNRRRKRMFLSPIRSDSTSFIITIGMVAVLAVCPLTDVTQPTSRFSPSRSTSSSIRRLLHDI